MKYLPALIFALVSIITITTASPRRTISLPLNFAKRKIEKRDLIGSLKTYGNDVYWWAEVSLGTPPQKCNMLIDTGSSNLWVYSKSCGTEDCFYNFKGTNRFDQFMSTSFKELGNKIYDITYGGGTGIAYKLAKDIFQISGITVDKQQIGTATNLVNRKIDFDGIIGLGREKNIAPSSLVGNIYTLTTTMLRKKLIEKNMFSLNLNTVAGGGGGEILFGGFNMSNIEGEIVYTPTVSQDHWSVEYTTICVETEDIHRSAKEAVLDTGCENILTSCGTAKAIYDEIPGAELYKTGDWIVPCKLSNTSVKFEIAGIKWSIPPEDLVTEPLADKEGYCKGAIQAEELPFDILGVPFIKQFYVVFDSDGERIGLAKKRVNYLT